MNKIVVVTLFKNEEVFLRQALDNIKDFADTVLLIDNESTDNSQSIALSFTKDNDAYSYIIEPNPKDTNKYLEEYIGTDSWVMGVDGDELYDPKQLKALREGILSGEYDQYSRIMGHTINPIVKTEDKAVFKCTTTPHSRSVVKLYNFKHITGLPVNERLHGELEWSLQNMLDLTTTSIDDSILTCCHMCFFRRSSKDESVPRSAPPGHGGVNYKMQNYAKGELQDFSLNNYGIQYASESIGR